MDRTNLNQEGWTRYAQYLGPLIATLLLASVSSFAGSLDHWIERNPLPTGNHLIDMAAGNGMFVAIGGHGIVLTSVNGDEWNGQAQRPLANPRAIAFGNGRFVTVGLDGIASSVDGVTWTKSPLAREITDSHGSPFLKEVVFGQGKFIALGDRQRTDETKVVVSTDGTTWSSTNISVWLETMAYGKNTFVGVGTGAYSLLSSTNGTEWTQRHAGNDWINGIAYGSGMFLAVRANGFAARSSDDGLTWQEFPLAKPLSGVFFGGGVFVAIASDGTIHRSLNGETWIEQPALTSRALTCWAYGRGTFVLGGIFGTIFSSTDAVEWIPRSSGPHDSLSGVTFGHGLFVAVGGKPSATETETAIDSAVIRTSPDGITWATLSPGDTRWLSDVSYGSDQFIAVGVGGTILTSKDGIKWERRDSGTTNNLSGVAYGTGTYVAVGGFDESHVILSSIDGITWIQRASGSNVLSSVAFGNGKFVAAGVFYDDRGDSHTYLLNSPDGIQWQQVSGDFRFRINDIAFGSGRFVAVGSYGFGSRTIVSTDGVSWTQSNVGVSAALNGVGFGNETFVSVGDYSFVVRSSIDGLNWDSRLFDLHRTLSGVAYGNGTFVVVGSRGTILQSANVAIPWLTLLQRPGGLTLTLDGEIGRVYRIEASTDLIGWSDIGSVTNSRMGTDFLDSTAGDSRQRFYRAVFP